MAPRSRVVPLDATLVVLAGGTSSRMGRAKQSLPVRGGTLLEWIVGRLAPSFRATLVAGAAAPHGARGVADRRDHAGPLAGIEAALAAMDTSSAFVVACDMPRVSEALAGLLVERCAGRDAAVPRVAGRTQPTCAAYARGALPAITAALDAGERRAARVLDELDVRYVDAAELAAHGISPGELADLDTPAEYEAFLVSLGP